MNRIIKFRVWDVENKLFINNLGMQRNNVVSNGNGKKMAIMQYTGFCDKDGKEIYEGDILKGGVYLAYEVKWDGYEGGWNISQNANMFQVVGNIFENPELVS